MTTAQTNIKFNDLIKTPEYKNTTAALPIILGVTKNGKIKIDDLQKIPHLFIGGRAGTGKTMFLESVLKSLSKKLSARECKFIIFDTKNNEFHHWKSDRHLLGPIITDTNALVENFDMILQMIDERYKTFLAHDVRNIWEYKKCTNKTMPAIVILVDEFSDLMAINKKHTEQFIKKICSRARATGIHIIAATSICTPGVITNTISAYFPTRIGFQTKTKRDAVKLLGEPGCETLSPCGDALYSEAGRIPVRIHTPYIQK